MNGKSKTSADPKNKVTLDLTSIQSAVKQSLSQQSQFAFLLGSAGTSRFHEESDIDLLISFQ